MDLLEFMVSLTLTVTVGALVALVVLGLIAYRCGKLTGKLIVQKIPFLLWFLSTMGLFYFITKNDVELPVADWIFIVMFFTPPMIAAIIMEHLEKKNTKQQTQIDDLKRELEEMKRKQSEPQS
jgi:ABC-type polysaccharide transport system permease subunit